MLLKKLFVRFYKSFNYDYLKKASLDKSQAKLWEWVDQAKTLWFPYVEIPIDDKITTVVGANESGKSHLLGAIKKGITGKNIEHEDFCRYSQFFTVTKGESRFPDFGFEWTNLSEDEQQTLRKLANIPEEVSYDNFLMFRNNKVNITIYIEDGDKFKAFSIDSNKDSDLSVFLPSILPIKSQIALPDSVPIQSIIDMTPEKPQGKKVTPTLEPWVLEKINEILDTIATGDPIHLTKGKDSGIRHNSSGEKVPMFNPSEFNKISDEDVKDIKIYNTLQNLLKTYGMTDKQKKERQEEFKLAYDLICKVAEIDPEFLEELVKNAFKVGKEGYLGAIIDSINKNLSERLNFRHWWVQDQDFNLVVSANNHHLKFSIKDKTGATYSFSERSQGLKYFLSYYIQYKSHQPSGNQQEILLMDEPDAFLSSQAQQDLMKIFKAFAEGKDGRKPVQVIFVTHSPFLIDKNHPERIRVLEKGAEEEGTRLVKDIARNHYEPLRSSVGSLIGETAYIGNCNLIVPRLSDQILIAGLATYLNQLQVSDQETLDLNNITIIPAGDVLQIPYLIHLLTRDTEKPAIITLLNSDDYSKKISVDIVNHELIKEGFIIKVGASDNFLEIEDLIPLSVAKKAITNYVKIFPNILQDIDLKTVESKFTNDNNISEYLKESKIDRLGFVRSVIELLQSEQLEQREIDTMTTNFKNLFAEINDKKAKATLDFEQEKIAEKVKHFIKAFKLDHPKDASRVDAETLFKKIEAILDTTKESNETHETINQLRQEYKVTTDPLSKIDDYSKFLDDLDKITYTPRLSYQDDQNVAKKKAESVETEDNKAESNSSSESSRSKSKQPKGFGKSL